MYVAIATNGFNPYGTHAASYTCWPVFVIPLNLAPDVMFEPNNVLLSLIIPGHPGNNMGVFMQPPWDELEHDWEMGVALEPQLSWPGGVPARPTQEVASDPLPTQQIGSAWVYNSTL